MTRIVAGSAKGRTIHVPKSGTRPTSERVREALFSRLAHYGYLDETTVLDLFAGSGALALEALSRGARLATCVEANLAAAKIIKQNALQLGFQLQIINQKAQTYLKNTVPHLQYDLVFLDPPYDFSEAALAEVLQELLVHLADNAMIIVERAKNAPEPSWPAGITLDDQRKWGDTAIWSAMFSKDAATPARKLAENLDKICKEKKSERRTRENRLD